MFFDRYEFHIHGCADFFKGVFTISRCPSSELQKQHCEIKTIRTTHKLEIEFSDIPNGQFKPTMKIGQTETKHGHSKTYKIGKG